MKKQNPSIVAFIFAATIMIGMIATILVGVALPERSDVIQGEIETTQYRVSSKVPGRVLEIRVEEGQQVHKGDTLAILEAPEVSAKYDQVNAQHDAASAISEKAQNGAQKEQIQAAFEMWQKAKAGLDVAEKSYKRVAKLYEQGVIAAQKHDEVKAQYDAMIATEKAAKSQYDMAVNGARYEDKKAAAAQVRQAEGGMKEVNSYINETYLIALADGQVTEIFPKLGELVGTGAPVMNVAMTNHSYICFNVREDFLPGITVGKEVEVYLPAFDKTIKAQVKRIKDVGNFATWKATKASDGYDLKMFEVRCVPATPADMKDARAGMSAILK